VAQQQHLSVSPRLLALAGQGDPALSQCQPGARNADHLSECRLRRFGLLFLSTYLPPSPAEVLLMRRSSRAHGAV